MRLYVCWDTVLKHPVLGSHPCGIAAHALREAGHEPEIVRSYGWVKLPRIFNQTPGRRAVREMTGSDAVPVLVLDGGEVIAGSQRIVSWAEANPAQPDSGVAASTA